MDKKITFQSIQNYQKIIDNLINYLKQHTCQHVIGIGIRLKLVTPPTHTIDLQFNKKQKEEEKEKYQQKVVKHLF